MIDILEVPFPKFIGIKRDPQSQRLTLAFSAQVENHIQTFHAGAQFSLMESCSGEFLQVQFPHLEGKVIPVLRKSEVKYKRPATSDLFASASCESEQVEKFSQQMESKGRATIVINLELKDTAGVLTSTANFEWFIQESLD